MSTVIDWLSENYENAGKFVLVGVAIPLLLGLLNAWLPNVGPLARWPSRAVATIGVVVSLAGIALVAGKLMYGAGLQAVSWLAVILTCGVGFIGLLVAWAMSRRLRSRVLIQLQPILGAIQRHIDDLRRGIGLRDYVDGPSSSVHGVVKATRHRRQRPAEVLVGEAGIGKTAALLEVASRLLNEFHVRAEGIVVPVYVDLSDYAQGSGPSFRRYILDSLSSDPELVRRFEKVLEDPHLNVRWLFLIDNADIETSGYWGGRRTDLATELSDFLHSNTSAFSAVLAARRPLKVPWAEDANLAELSKAERDRLLISVGATSDQCARLGEDKSARRFLRNPGFLRLVGGSLDHLDPTAPNVHALVGEVIVERLSPVSRITIRYAEDMAIHFVGRAPNRGVPLAELIDHVKQRYRRAPEAFEREIRRLIAAGLVRSTTGLGGLESVEFSHPVLLDHFAANRLVVDRSVTTDEQLLIDDRWSMPTVFMMRVVDEGRLGELARTAHAVLTELEAEFSDSPPDTLIAKERDGRRLHAHVLQMFDAGLQFRESIITEVLRDHADVTLTRSFPNANEAERTELMDMVNFARPEGAADACSAALRSASGEIAGRAATMLVGRGDTWEFLDLRDRVAVLLVVALRGLPSQAIPEDGSAHTERMRLASSVGAATTIVFGVTFVVGAILRVLVEPADWGWLLIELIGGGTITATVAGTRWLRWPTSPLTLQGAKVPFAVTAFLLSFALIGLGTTALAALGSLSLNALAVLVFAIMAWPGCALFYLAWVDDPSKYQLIFPFPWIAQPLYAEVKAWLEAQSTQST